MRKSIAALWALSLLAAVALPIAAQSAHRVWTQQVVVTVREAIEVVWRLPDGDCVGDTCELVLSPGDVATGQATISNVSAKDRMVSVACHSSGGFGGVEAGWLGYVYDVPGQSSVTTDFVITATYEGGPITYTLTAMRTIP